MGFLGVSRRQFERRATSHFEKPAIGRARIWELSSLVPKLPRNPIKKTKNPKTQDPSQKNKNPKTHQPQNQNTKKPKHQKKQNTSPPKTPKHRKPKHQKNPNTS